MSEMTPDYWRRYTVNPLGLNQDGQLLAVLAVAASGADRQTRLRVIPLEEWCERMSARNRKRVRWPSGARKPR